MLKDILIIRPVMILSIIIGHCFAIYSGAWNIPENIQHIHIYEWINPLFISFQLPAFVYISGYLFSFQIDKKGDSDSYRTFLVSKIKRLYIPAIVFGIVYILLFVNFSLSKESMIHYGVRVVNGYAHLWFLPMLFFCYITHKAVYKIIDKHSKLSILFALALVATSFFIPFSFSAIASFCYYYFFFVLGYLSHKHAFYKSPKLKLLTVSSLLGFALLFAVSYQLRNGVESLLLKALVVGVKFGCSILGIFMIFGFVNIVLNYYNSNKKDAMWSLLGKISFPMYVFHQFIVVFFLYNGMFSLLNPYLFPFVLLLLALVGSFTLLYSLKVILA